jgi:hypothetical protein
MAYYNVHLIQRHTESYSSAGFHGKLNDEGLDAGEFFVGSSDGAWF